MPHPLRAQPYWEFQDGGGIQQHASKLERKTCKIRWQISLRRSLQTLPRLSLNPDFATKCNASTRHNVSQSRPSAPSRRISAGRSYRWIGPRSVRQSKTLIRSKLGWSKLAILLNITHGCDPSVGKS